MTLHTPSQADIDPGWQHSGTITPYVDPNAPPRVVTQDQVVSQNQSVTQDDQDLLDEKAMGLHVRGNTYRQIAATMGISKTTAHEWVQRYMRQEREQFAAHEADVRDECVFALKQGIGHVIADASRGDKESLKLLMQYTGLRVRLLKIASPARIQKTLEEEGQRSEGKGQRSEEVVGGVGSEKEADEGRTNGGQTGGQELEPVVAPCVREGEVFCEQHADKVAENNDLADAAPTGEPGSAPGPAATA